MLILHHLRIGRSIFTVWLLEELGLEYELKVYHRDPDTMRAPAELRDVHPLGKSPVIEVDGQVLSESGAITSYLLQTRDSANMLAPGKDDHPAWLNFTRWLHYPEGSAFLPLFLKMMQLRAGQLGPLDAFLEPEVALHLNHINDSLGSQPYILGEQFSAADIGVGYVVSMADRLGQLESYPTLKGYIERLQARPAFQQAVERAVE